MDDNNMLIIGKMVYELSGLAIACNNTAEEMRVMVAEISCVMKIHMRDVARQLNQAFCPAIELSSSIKENNLLRDRISVDVVSSGKKTHSYDEFLPKPIGNQRRR